ncbi:hypothetical protein ACQPYA_30010 [Micromonospora sp. CA-263727]|uniref:hypothetical protein n=1 Tax=Micromonospora sp. CA-263727 TaxID=3239967 RepID=UPI003D8DE795
MIQGSRLSAGQVFVAGGLPTITYSPRADLGLEARLQDYLDEKYRILSISGPTKTGKTVLVKNVLQDVDKILISGGDIRSVGDLWGHIADHLSLVSSYEETRQDTDAESRTLGGDVQLPGMAKLSRSGQESVSSSTSDKTIRNRSADIAAKKALRTACIPLIIDDFHYIPADVQIDIVRSLKDLVFDGLPVIVIAVPHRAYDVIRVEKEMTGRVEQLPVGFWSNAELRGIAQKGFEALNVLDEAGVITERLAAESFASPHLMQSFCLEVVKGSGIREKQAAPTLLHEPMWTEFFKERSVAASKTAFDKLARGPRQRTDRKPRTLKNGLTVDIYGAVLMAIGHTGPLTSISYESLRAAMRDIAAEDAPSGQEITRILGEMTKIAREIDGEPVVDYDASLATLHISDPFFAFFLKWRAGEELAAREEQMRTTFTPPANPGISWLPKNPAAGMPARKQPKDTPRFNKGSKRRGRGRRK